MREGVKTAAKDAAFPLPLIADFAPSDDLPVRLREAKQLFGDGHAVGIVDEKTSSRSRGDLDENDMKIPKFLRGNILSHATGSSSCHTTATGGPERDRGHVRFIPKSSGKPILEFESTYEMVTALRDAITGHDEAHKAGNIHRDLSRGNVMIMKKPDELSDGFIHDFDYGLSWVHFLKAANLPPDIALWVQYTVNEYLNLIVQHKRDWDEKVNDSDTDDTDDELGAEQTGGGDEQGTSASAETLKTPLPRPLTLVFKEERLAKMADEQKRRTGTFHFMAVETYTNTIIHEPRHDLESFFWLLIWLILRHTSHECHDPDWEGGTWYKLFDGARMFNHQVNKRVWLTEPYPIIAVKDNPPLTRLLERFRRLCQRNFDRLDLKEPWMTHADVLQLFNKALEKPHKWPQNDKAISWCPSVTQPGSIMGEIVSGTLQAKGTLSFVLPSSHLLRNTAAPSSPIVQPDVNQTGSVSGAEVQEGEVDEKGTEAKRKGDVLAIGSAPLGRGAILHRAPLQASTSRSHALESHESPSSSNPALEYNGSESAHHPSGYNLRSSNKDARELRVWSKACGTGPPLVPRSRSSTRQGIPSIPLAVAGPSTYGSRSSKRERTREDEAEERAAGTSHSPKRPRTLSSQHGPEEGKKSRKRKGKGKKRAS